MFNSIGKRSSIFESASLNANKVSTASVSPLPESDICSGNLKRIRCSDAFIPSTKAPEKALYRRFKQGDPSVSVVNMNEGKAIEVQPGKEHTLFTYALGGCQAVLVLGEQPNGKKTAILTHYSPTSRDTQTNLQQIRQLIRKYPDLKSKKVKLTSIILVPGDPEINKNTLIAQDPRLVKTLQSTIQDELGKNVTKKVFPYSLAGLRTGKSNAFIIKFPSESNKPVRYEAHGTYYGKLDDKIADEK